MLKKQLNKSKEQGFTIIEVLIVLAIAGLILLIVFLAVPALQRNSRNTRRNSDVAGLIGAFNEYVNNQGGSLPTAACDGTTPCAWYANWKPGYYNATTTNVAFQLITATGTVLADPASVDKINMGAWNTCNPAGTAAVQGTSRQVAVVYDVEQGGGTTQEECKTAG